MDINVTVAEIAKAHPFYAFAAGCVLGPLWPKAVTWMMTDGVDFCVSHVMNFQEFYLRKIGATDAQIVAIQRKEAEALERAAQDVKKDADGIGKPPKP